MRKKSYLVALIFIFSFGLTLAWVFGAQTSSGVAASPNAELHVCPSGCPYSNVQDAVDAAIEGDIIKVAQGTYAGVSVRDGIKQTVYLSKTLTIQGGYTTSNWTTPNPEVNITKLDAQGLGRVIFMAGEIDATITGLHITGGNSLGQGENDQGGGIYANIQNMDRFITLRNNHIYSNTATSDGGGVGMNGMAKLTLSDNTFEGNTATQGGGLFLHVVFVTLINNLFASNIATDNGGGLRFQYTYEATLKGNTYRDNYAQHWGGGLFVDNTPLKADGETIIRNTTNWIGGGLYISGQGQDTWIVNTLVADNQANGHGSGIYLGGVPVRLQHISLSGNIGGEGSGVTIGDAYPGGSSGPSNVDMKNIILANQELGLQISDASSVVVDSILWHSVAITLTEVPESDVSLVNQLYGDPVFADPANGDYHITGASAARDVGVNADVYHDLDGHVRKMGFGFDPGAYEYPDAALSLYKTPELIGVNVGEELIYTIIMTSSGVLDASNVVLTDTLDAWQRATAVDSTDGNCIIDDSGWGGTVICSPGNLNIGDVIEIALTAQVSPIKPLGQAMLNTLSALAVETDNSLQTQPVYAQDCHVRIGDNPKTYTSVQAAVDAAYPTAIVKVAGTCTGVYGPEGWRQQVFIDQPLTLQGGYTASNWTTPDPEANLTTLDARGQGRVLYIYKEDWTQWMDVQIDGLHITGGSSYGQSNHDPFGEVDNSGGGVYVYGADPTFTNDHIIGNTSPGNGGGVMGSFAYLSFRGTTISNNTTLGDGGGVSVHAEGSEFIDTRFEGNSANNGGGFSAAVYGGGQFTRNIFIGNHANGFGGGLAVETAAFIKETLILSNTAERGGGIGFFEGLNPWNPYAIITNTIIANNQATLGGSGIFIPSGGAVKMLHVTLARNTGGDGSGVTLGWYDWMSPGTSTLLITDTIMSYQDAGIRAIDASNVTANGVLWFANSDNVWQSPDATVVLMNEHTGDPAFLNPDYGDYHIGKTSAARDTGVPSGVTHDIDGERRPMGLGWDLGADEYFLNSTYLPLTLRK